MSENDELKRMRMALAKIADVASEAVGPGYQAGQSKLAPGKRATPRIAKPDLDRADPFKRRSMDKYPSMAKSQKHVCGRGVVCGTDKRGYANPRDLDPTRLRVDAPGGFIPLWARNMTLRWRFNRDSMISYFADPEGAMEAIEELFAEAMENWGDAVPVRFSKQEDSWDFQFVMLGSDECDESGCVLAQSFFPDGGRHQLYLYPKMFEQDRREQIETLVHEFGHVFGLRHFFANIDEQAWPSELFGTDSPFSIMNYGENSVLTEADKRDLKRLYEAAWNDELLNINGTPIRFVKPFHASGQLCC